MTAQPGPRILPLKEPPPDVAATVEKAVLSDGRPFNVAATLARHPRLLRRFLPLAGLFVAHSDLPQRDRELLTLRSAYRCEAEYYFGHHAVMAAAAGVSDDDIRAVTDRSHQWSERDGILISVADQLTADVRLDDLTWDALTRIYDDAQVMEAILLVGFYRMMAGFVNSLGIEREMGIPGWPDQH